MADNTTLDDLMRIRAEELTPADLEAIVAGLHEQRARWQLNQAQGSRKIVKASAIKPGAIPIDLSAIAPPRKITL